jgi:DHA3 family macrolide efflux protein-like MFS transporter
MMLGGGIIASWGGFKNRVYTMTFASLLMGICTFALGIVPIFSLYLLFMAIFGVAMPIFNTPTMVLIQEKVEENYLGRIFGVFGMISTSMMPMGMLIFGPMADLIEIEILLITTGMLLIIIAILLGKNKTLVKIGKPALTEPT